MPPRRAAAIAADAKSKAAKDPIYKATKAKKPAKANSHKTTKTPEATANATTTAKTTKAKPKTAKTAAKPKAANAQAKPDSQNTEENLARSASAIALDSQQAEPKKMPKSTKRKATDEQEVPAPKKIRIARLKDEDKNAAPTQKLNVFVFGEGSSGELGLGSAKTAVDVKRPRLNPLLPADKVGVVQVATGGMHVLALTHDNKILSWGVNDQGALGRDTQWDGGLIDMDDAKSDDSSDSGSDSGMNPREATPTAIPEDAFPADTKFVQVAAADSSSFALTDDGLVYGWGTFRSNEGIFGFNKEVIIQYKPVLLPNLKKIRQISCGANHVLALDADGNVFAWGSGQQNQLGRRVVERTKVEGLVPREFGLPRKQIVGVACGAYHSFAVDKKDNVWAWGLNNFGETGIPENAGEDDAVVLKPARVDGLAGKKIKQISGGGHHSACVTEDGQCLVWGRIDGYQMGIAQDTIKGLPEEAVRKDLSGNPRILRVPTAVPGISASHVACGSDHTIAITTDGRAYSWGFNANYQTGTGSADDVEVATLIDNTAVRGRRLNWAGAGGQYSVLTSPADVPMANGI
ncbi:pheromone response pathway component SRM1 [Saccharata proteae CBS 121410]|uniref:Pheromone response pathway component SRM1 n=1 Tax=Saccharata proteae CBS 121410 TaxID=1314787 RepID=A0A9P4HRE1_9PEZI|nr:pheromone response pathway component SRM1 [Saccharata proteae CBS 121410]